MIFNFTTFAHAEEERAGVVKNIIGKALIERNKYINSTNVKDTLLEKDILITGRDESMGITLQDNSVISIDPNTRIVISKLLYDTAAE
jgi:hypothetical protein